MPERHPVRPEDARQQAAEYLGFMMGKLFDLGNGDRWELPNSTMMSDEQRTRYDQYRFECENLDRHPDIMDADGNVVTRGEPLDPPRIDGKLVEPDDTRLAKALMGNSVHKKFVAAGGYSSQVRIHWWEMNKAMAERSAEDPKSVGSDNGVAEVPDGNRIGTIEVSPAADS